MKSETAELLERRALAFCLAARLTSWPEPDDAVPMLAAELEGGDAEEGALRAQALTFSAGDVEAEYIRLFENGADRCPIHETEYGRMRGMAKGNELADIAGFYEAFGLGRADSQAGRQMGDHLSVELEFYGVLLARQAHLLETEDREGSAIVEDARRKFLIDHLGRLATVIADQPAVQRSATYGPLLQSTRALVAAECRRLAVVPAPIEFLPTAGEGDALCCGGSVAQA